MITSRVNACNLPEHNQLEVVHVLPIVVKGASHAYNRLVLRDFNCLSSEARAFEVANPLHFFALVVEEGETEQKVIVISEFDSRYPLLLLIEFN